MKKITTLLMLAIMTTFGWQANSQMVETPAQPRL